MQPDWTLSSEGSKKRKKKMNSQRVFWWAARLAVICCALMPAAVWATANSPGSGMQGTTHDFTRPTASPPNTYKIGMCTYCHTPHQAITQHLLWNHVLSTNSFSWDVTYTTAGTTLPTNALNSWQGSSTRCLSCHDGSVAEGDVNWWEGAGPQIVPSTGGKIPVDSFGNAGGALKGNHPIAVPYPYLQTANTYNTATTAANFAGGIPAGWYLEWVSSPAYPIRLFNDNGSGIITAGAVAGKTGIECTSCHDIHNDEDVADPLNLKDKNNYYLRGTLTGNGSANICEGCHQK